MVHDAELGFTRMREEVGRGLWQVFKFVLLFFLVLMLWLHPPPSASPRPHTVIREAATGRVSALKERMTPWPAHWTTVEGRITLRMAAVEAARAGHVKVLDYLCDDWKVPINSIPKEERVKSGMQFWVTPLASTTPLLAAVMAEKKDAALHLLSLAEKDQDLELDRRLKGGNTLLHYATRTFWKDQADLVGMLLRHGAPAHVVAGDGHTPLSLAVDDSLRVVARILLDDYRDRGKLQEAFEQSFYDHGQKHSVSLLHRVASRQGGGYATKNEAEMVDMARFLVGQGANVTVRNKWMQTPAEVALSHCGIPFLPLFVTQCSAPLLNEYLRHVADECGGEEEAFADVYSRASSRGPETAYCSWFLLAGGVCLLYGLFTRDERIRKMEKAAVLAARKRACDEEQERRKEKQQGKNDRKDDRKMMLEATTMGSKNRSEVPVTAVEAKRKTKKRNKNKKPAHLEQQQVVEPGVILGGNADVEVPGATTLQAPVREQQMLATMALEKEARATEGVEPPPSPSEIKAGARSEKGDTKAELHLQELPAAIFTKVEDDTSVYSSPQHHDHDQDEGEEAEGKEGGEEEDEEEEDVGMPDEAFLLEGASSMLVCPISFKLMTSAVIAMDTQSYQKEALEGWMERCKSKGVPLTSPLTNVPMESQMMANQTVRGLVCEHVEAREQAWRQQLAEGREKKKQKNTTTKKKKKSGGREIMA